MTAADTANLAATLATLTDDNLLAFAFDIAPTIGDTATRTDWLAALKGEVKRRLVAADEATQAAQAVALEAQAATEAAEEAEEYHCPEHGDTTVVGGGAVLAHLACGGHASAATGEVWH